MNKKCALITIGLIFGAQTCLGEIVINIGQVLEAADTMLEKIQPSESDTTIATKIKEDVINNLENLPNFVLGTPITQAKASEMPQIAQTIVNVLSKEAAEKLGTKAPEFIITMFDTFVDNPAVAFDIVQSLYMLMSKSLKPNVQQFFNDLLQLGSLILNDKSKETEDTIKFLQSAMEQTKQFIMNLKVLTGTPDPVKTIQAFPFAQKIQQLKRTLRQNLTPITKVITKYMPQIKKIIQDIKNISAEDIKTTVATSAKGIAFANSILSKPLTK